MVGRVFILAVCSVLMNTACGLHVAPVASTTPTQQWTAPDSRGVLRLFSRDGVAHGCPVAEYYLLTARHVAVDEQQKKLASVVWSDREGHTGSAWTEDYDLRRDVAIMKSDTPFHYVYPLASTPPTKDEKVVIVGYDFGEGLAPKIVTVKVVRQISAHLILTEGGTQGFSGSCVLNAHGQVVGIFHWTIGNGMGTTYGVASVVTDGWHSVGWLPSGGK